MDDMEVLQTKILLGDTHRRRQPRGISELYFNANVVTSGGQQQVKLSPAVSRPKPCLPITDARQDLFNNEPLPGRAAVNVAK